MENKRARGEVKKLLIMILEVQNLVGKARGLHQNDRSQTSFEEAQNCLERAFALCVQATELFDPESFDPYYNTPTPPAQEER